jgi:hypothetical protein
MNINKVYTFSTNASALLGSVIKNAKLIGTMDYVTAMGYENIGVKYRSIFPLLPNGTPDDPASSIYYRFLTESGEKIIMCDQWINMSTVEVVEHVRLKVQFTEVGINDISTIRDALNSLGYTKFTITQE